jgi:ABC-type Co2+ transport system permease subunit
MLRLIGTLVIFFGLSLVFAIGFANLFLAPLFATPILTWLNVAGLVMGELLIGVTIIFWKALYAGAKEGINEKVQL